MKTVLNVKVDSHIKIQAQKVAYDIGLPISILVNNYLKELISNKEAYFSVRELNEKSKKRLARIDKDIKNNRNLSPKFYSAKEMDKYLTYL